MWLFRFEEGHDGFRDAISIGLRRLAQRTALRCISIVFVNVTRLLKDSGELRSLKNSTGIERDDTFSGVTGGPRRARSSRRAPSFRGLDVGETAALSHSTLLMALSKIEGPVEGNAEGVRFIRLRRNPPQISR
jgi:hypothetical protein